MKAHYRYSGISIASGFGVHLYRRVAILQRNLAAKMSVDSKLEFVTSDRNYSSPVNYLDLIPSLSTLLILTSFIFLFFLVNFFLTELVWPGWFISKNFHTVDLNEYGDFTGRLKVSWLSVVPSDRPGELTIAYHPEEKLPRDYELLIEAGSDFIQIAFPANSVPNSSISLDLESEEKSQAQIVIISQIREQKWSPFLRRGEIKWELVDKGNGSKAMLQNLPVYFETPFISLWRNNQFGGLKDSPLLLSISALVWLGSIYLKVREHRQVKAPQYLEKIRTHLKQGDIGKVNNSLNELKNRNLDTFISKEDLAQVKKLVNYATSSFPEILDLSDFPDGWGDETAGVMLHIIDRQPFSLTTENKIMLLRKFPAHRCSTNIWDEIRKRENELGGSGISIKCNWPDNISVSIKKSKLGKFPFFNPYIAPEAEFEEYYLHSRNAPLFWPDHPLYDLLKAQYKQKFTGIIGTNGSGKTAIGMALSVYHPDERTLGVYITGCPDIQTIRLAFSKRLLEFMCCNPAHLSLLDGNHRDVLSALLKGAMGLTPVLGQLERAIKDKVEKESDSLQEIKVQWGLFRNSLINATSLSVNSLEWASILEEVTHSLNLPNLRLVIDTGFEDGPAWFEKAVIEPHYFINAAKFKVILLIHEKQDLEIEALEHYQVTLFPMLWQDKNNNWLDEMLKHRWKIYNGSNQIEQIKEIYDVYQNLMVSAKGNPAEFIRLWRTHYNLDIHLYTL
jgi:hypothetical protein